MKNNTSLKKGQVWFGIKISLITIVFAVLLYHMKDEFVHIWIIPIYLIVGYYFGKITCGTHSKKYGLWLTFGLFISLNFIHSLFDGILSASLSTEYRTLAIYSHELIRQPALYVVIWGMLAPFSKKYHKIIMSVLAVTGVWLLAMYIGTFASSYINQYSSLNGYIAMTIFIFLGDIIHHLVDEYFHMKHSHRKTTA
jgi:hypothetical protein